LSFASRCFSLRILLRQVLTFFIYTIQKLSSCLCIYPLPHTTGPCRQHACILSITSAFAFHYHSTFCSCAWHPTTNTYSHHRWQVSMPCHALRAGSTLSRSSLLAAPRTYLLLLGLHLLSVPFPCINIKLITQPCACVLNMPISARPNLRP
jgi:hypothetical protein